WCGSASSIPAASRHCESESSERRNRLRPAPDNFSAVEFEVARIPHSNQQARNRSRPKNAYGGLLYSKICARSLTSASSCQKPDREEGHLAVRVPKTDQEGQ